MYRFWWKWGRNLCLRWKKSGCAWIQEISAHASLSALWNFIMNYYCSIGMGEIIAYEYCLLLGLGKKGNNIKTYFFTFLAKITFFTFMASKITFFPFLPKIKNFSRLRRKNKPFLGSFLVKTDFLRQNGLCKGKIFLDFFFQLQNYFLVPPIAVNF